MMQSEMLPIVSVWLSWKMNMIAISLYLMYLYRRWKMYIIG
jgi:hypothetical protein